MAHEHRPKPASGGCCHAQAPQPAPAAHRHAHRSTVPAAGPPAMPPADAIYTCPMHPEIRQDHPGHCPKCGMALEPLMPELGARTTTRSCAISRRRFWWTLPLTIVVTVLAMFGHRLGWMAIIDADMGGARALCADRAVGRLAVLRARRAVDRASQPEHVDADRSRHCGGVHLQRGRDASRRVCFRRASWSTDASACTTKRRP